MSTATLLLFEDTRGHSTFKLMFAEHGRRSFTVLLLCCVREYSPRYSAEAAEHEPTTLDAKVRYEPRKKDGSKDWRKTSLEVMGSNLCVNTCWFCDT